MNSPRDLSFMIHLLFRRWRTTFLFMEFHAGCWPTMAHSFPVENLEGLLKNGIFIMLLVALISLSPMAWLRMQWSKPRTCLTNARGMVQIICLAFLMSGMFHEIKFLVSLCNVWCLTGLGAFFQFLVRSSLLPGPLTTNMFPCDSNLSVCSKRSFRTVVSNLFHLSILSRLWDFTPARVMRKLVLWNNPLQTHGPILPTFERESTVEIGDIF